MSNSLIITIVISAMAFAVALFFSSEGCSIALLTSILQSSRATLSQNKLPRYRICIGKCRSGGTITATTFRI